MIVERERDRLPARAGPVGRQFVAADRAEPGKERRFAAPRANLPRGDDERRLDDVLGGVFIAKSSHREAEQAREVRAEELIERALVAGSHALNELSVIHIDDPCLCSLPPVPSPELPGVMSIRGAGWPESFACLRETHERARRAARHDRKEDDDLTNPHTTTRPQ